MTQSPASAPHTAGVKLNLFQRLVLQWESLHPYNGVQAMKICGRLNLQSCRQAWHEAMEVLGLGRVSFQGDSYRYQCLNGDAIEQTVQLCSPGASIPQWISQEMNRPFGDLEAVPFRPFAIQNADHFWIGLCYRHWLADSVSIRILMREWFARQFDPASATTRALRVHARGGYIAQLAPGQTNRNPGSALLASMRWHAQFRRTRRVEDREKFRDLSARFQMFETPPGLVEPLRAKARKLGATINDVFLAAIAQAACRHVPQVRRFHRQDLAVATIVDLRPTTAHGDQDVFNLHLGFTSVCCSPGNLENWDSLLRSVVRQGQRNKSNGFAQMSWVRVLTALVAGKIISRDDLFDFYRKRVALAGAISNVNLNQSWVARYHPDPLLQYVRAAPTGPMAPLVFSTTTLGPELSIGLTYRPALLPDDRAAMIAGEFIARLARVAG